MKKYGFLLVALMGSLNAFAGNEGPHASPVELPKPFLRCENRNVRALFSQIADDQGSYHVDLRSGNDVLGYHEFYATVDVSLPSAPHGASLDGGTVRYEQLQDVGGSTFSMEYRYFGFPPSKFTAEMTYQKNGYDDVGQPVVVTEKVRCQNL
jgi:hypothetical protein